MIFGVGVDVNNRIKIDRKSHDIRIRFNEIVGLPNLSITTAARYLRHYSLSDLSTPFQDYPCSQEHFPASFAFAPPDFKDMPDRLTTHTINRPVASQ